MKQKITPYLWFEQNGQEAAEYYVSIFPNARMINSSPLVNNFEIEGQQFAILTGGPHHKFNDAVSFMVHCEDQTEVDYFWNKLIGDGGKESQCGWLKDKYGLSWQIIPADLRKCLGHPDPEKAQKAMQAMLKMKKIIVEDLLNAIK